MSYSVIIPSRTAENLRACVSSIRAAHETSRIIVVDDFAAEDLDEVSARFTHEGDVKVCQWVTGVKPFVFARNINLGIAAAGEDDVVLLNDDTRLLTPYGFSYLASIAREYPEYGIISAGITDAVGNREQLAQPGTRLREAQHHTLVFVCVYIRREVLTGLMTPGGVAHANTWWLDERYANYGYDDDDLCERTRQLVLKLGVFDGCVVEHGVLPSTFRGDHGNTGISDLRPNRDRFIEKWGFAPGQGPSMKREVPGTLADKVKW